MIYNLQFFGGRGARFGRYKKNINGTVKDMSYGDEYETLLRYGDIKFVQQKDTDASITAPMETKTKNRIYVTLSKEGEPKAVTLYDSDGKRRKQIDISGHMHKIDGVDMTEHTHLGYFHAENGTRRLSEAERNLIDRIIRMWYSKHESNG